MSRPGAKPKPVAVKQILGAARASRRLSTCVPAPIAGEIPIPASVAGDPAAFGYWKHYTENAAPGHLAPLDGPTLGMLCTSLARRDKAERAMGAEMVIKSPNAGIPIQSPWLAIINRQTVICERLMAALCISPAERNRLGVNMGDQAADSADKYFTN